MGFFQTHAKKIVYYIFVLIGAGVLLPWNAFIMALDYFSLIYPGVPFGFLLPIVYDSATVVFFLVSIFYAERIPIRLRVFGFFALDFVCLVIVPVFAVLLKAGSLAISFVAVGATGAATAILTGSSIAIASSAGVEYVNALMIGQGIAGIIVAVIRIITKAALPTDMEGYLLSGTIYFVISAVIIFMCIVGYYLIEFQKDLSLAFRNPYEKKVDGDDVDDKPLIADDLPINAERTAPKDVGIFAVLGKIWRDAASTFLVFFMTISMFPGMTNRIQSTHAALGDWFMVITSTVFMVFDLVGRTTPSFGWAVRWLDFLLHESLARFIFYPLFLFSIYNIVESDVYVCVVMALFAFTNGYVSTLSMGHGTERCTQQEKQIGSDLMGLSLNFSILLASLAGYGINELTQNAPN